MAESQKFSSYYIVEDVEVTLFLKHLGAQREYNDCLKRLHAFVFIKKRGKRGTDEETITGGNGRGSPITS